MQRQILDYFPKLVTYQRKLAQINDPTEKYTFENIGTFSTEGLIKKFYDIPPNANTDLLLFVKKMSVLEKMNEALNNLVAPFTDDSLAQEVNRIIAENISVLMEEFKSCPNTHLAQRLREIVETFIDEKISINTETELYLTSTPKFAFVYDKGQFKRFDWREQPPELARKLFINIIKNTSKNNWFKLQKLALNLFDDCEKLENLIKTVAHESQGMHRSGDVLQHVFGIKPVTAGKYKYYKIKYLHRFCLFNQNNEMVNFEELYRTNRHDAHKIMQDLLKHYKKPWYEIRDLLKFTVEKEGLTAMNMGDMHHFIMESKHSLADLKQLFCLPYHRNLIKSVSSPSFIADSILHLPNSLDKKEKINLIFQKYATTDAKTEKQIKDHYRTILNRCLKHHGKTDLSKMINSVLELLNAISTKRLASLENIYKELVLILQTGDTKQLQQYLLNAYLGIRASRNGAGSDLGHALQKWLNKEYEEVTIQSKVDQTISTLSELNETDSYWNNLHIEFNNEARKILGKYLVEPLSAKPKEDKEKKIKTPEYFKALVDAALQKLVRLKKSSCFISFFTNPYYTTRIEQLRDLLAKHHVYVPHSFTADKVVTIEDFDFHESQTLNKPR